MKSLKNSISAGLFGIAMVLGGASAAVTAAELNLGAASDFAVLSAAPDGGGAVTCTDSLITGNVGSSGLAAAVVQTHCTITGDVVAPVSDAVIADFNDAYGALAALACDATLTGTLAGVTLAPGVYCFDAAATVTRVLTLAGSSTDEWIFKVGTSGTGALTGTDFSVIMANGAVACENVYWWVAEAATLTTSQFQGTVLAGAAITLTGGSFDGDALAKAGVTLTNSTATGCEGSVQPPKPPRQRCNQGVGNGPEACDPGNSNQGNPFRSNDELGGTPGDPGRKGGNNK